MTAKLLASILSPVTQIVVQSTSFCNLDCTYCYLPNRSTDKRITWDTLNTLMGHLESANLLSSELEIRWHAGEPLAIPFEFYEKCVKYIDNLYGNTRVINHSIQTNATLIDQTLAGRISVLGMKVGVSLDGPEWLHNRYRRYRSGKGSFKAVMKGIEALRDQKIQFEIISVITRDTLANHSDFYKFMESTGATRLGLNFEETEGSYAALWNDSDLISLKAFAHDLYGHSETGRLKIREFEILKRLILAKTGVRRDLQNTCGSILALGSNGDVTTFSPELLGLQHVNWPSFSIARVDESNNSMVIDKHLLSKMKKEIDQGVDNCRNSCMYYSVCGGGRPVNKIFENNRFDSTETRECQLRVKILTQVVVEAMEKIELYN